MNQPMSPSDEEIADLSLQFVGIEPLSDFDYVGFARALLAQYAAPAVQPVAADIAPGVMRCARCKFRLHRISLNVNVGTVTAGDNKTEPCPNGCGPLWPVTWKQEAEEAMQVAEGLCDRAVAAERELADLRERLGPRATQPLKAEQAKDAAEDAPDLTKLDELAKAYAAIYYSPHHFTA